MKMALGESYLPILFGGAKELGIVHISIIRGAKEPRNLQNHRGVMVLTRERAASVWKRGILCEVQRQAVRGRRRIFAKLSCNAG